MPQASPGGSQAWQVPGESPQPPPDPGPGVLSQDRARGLPAAWARSPPWPLIFLWSRLGWPWLPSLVSQSPGLGWQWTFIPGRGRCCYLQFCLLGDTVERTQAEGAGGPQEDPIPPRVGQTDLPSGLRLDTRAGLRGAPGRGCPLAGDMRSCGESRSAGSWAEPPSPAAPAWPSLGTTDLRAGRGPRLLDELLQVTLT